MNGKKDYLNLFNNGQPQYKNIMRILGFTKKHVACATNIPFNKINFKKGIPTQLRQHFCQWANLINLVAGFFDGDEEKTILWLVSSNPLLGDIPPRNMILMGRYEKLLKFVENSLAENKR